MSHRPLLLVCLSALLLAVGCARRPPTERERLEGAWQAQVVVIDGQANPPLDMRDMILRLTPSQAVFEVAGARHQGYWYLDLSESPSRLKVLPLTAGGPHQPLFAIYKLNSPDHLQMCFSEKGYPRELEAQPGSGRILVHFQRIPEEAGTSRQGS